MEEKLREALASGRDLYKQREFSRAEPYLAQVAAAKLPYADVFNMLGVIYHDGGHFTKAQTAFEEALRINPSYTEASLNLAVTYNDMGRYVEARELYMGALTSSTKPGGKLDSFVQGKLANMYADIAEVYAAAGAFEEAIFEYRRALQLRPAFVDLRVKLAETLRDAGLTDPALNELRLCLQQSPDYLPARLHLGLTQFSMGDHAGSLSTFDDILTAHPQHPRAKLYKAMITEHLARPKAPAAPQAAS